MRLPVLLARIIIGFTLAADLTAAAPAQTSAAMLRGVLTDEAGALLPNAKVTVTIGGTTESTISGNDGSYAFRNLPSGAYTLTVTAAGLQPVTMTGTMSPDQSVVIAPIALRVATVSAEVNAISQRDAAEQQIEDEEHQRLLGVIPNFFVVYNGNTVPLDTRQKFKLSFRTLVDPAVFATTAINAGIKQGIDAYPEFGRGGKAYATYYAASYGDAFVGILLSGAILPTVFHQDPRYFVKGTGTTRSRVVYALTRAVEQRGDNGRWQPAYSNLLGNAGSSLISTAYYPHNNINWGATAGENFAIGIGSEALGNLLEEFVFNHLTTRKK